jgi:integrase
VKQRQPRTGGLRATRCSKPFGRLTLLKDDKPDANDYRIFPGSYAPISDAAMDRLKVIPRVSDNPYIICGRLPGQYHRSLDDPFRRALKRAGPVNLRIHDLRRTVGSWLTQDGQSLHLIGDVLNHRDPKTTAGYAYFPTQQRRDALTGHGNRGLAHTPAYLSMAG